MSLVGYEGPRRLAQEMADLVPHKEREAATVLDLAAGTGLVGEQVGNDTYIYITGLVGEQVGNDTYIYHWLGGRAGGQ